MPTSGEHIGSLRRPSIAEVNSGLEQRGVRGRADLLYAGSLYMQRLDQLAGRAPQGNLRILTRDGGSFIPSAAQTEAERTTYLGAVDYGSQLEGQKIFLDTARNTRVVEHRLDGGSWTNGRRERYLAQIGPSVGRGERPRPSAKGADLYYKVVIPGFNEDGQQVMQEELIHVMEMKTLSLLQQARAYRKIDIRPIVSPEAEKVLDAFHNSVYLFDRVDKRPGSQKRTYNDIFESEEHIGEISSLRQDNLPSINAATGELTNDHPSHGSHGRPCSIALQQITEVRYGKAEEGPQVRVFKNGDGSNNDVTPEMVGFAVAEAAGVVMVTTTKVPFDIKGGEIGVEVVKTRSGEVRVPQIMELKQAANVGQRDLFYATGLAGKRETEQFTHHESGQQYFNTNTAILNETALRPFLRRLRGVIGEEAFRRAVTPDLIHALDKSEKYELLEGTMGSVLLNLARTVETNPKAKELWEDMSGGKKFLRIINVDPSQRDEVFTPIKLVIDYIVQAATDLYEMDSENFRLRNTRPGHLPVFDGTLVEQGQHAFYADVANGLDALGHTKIRELDYLSIEDVPVGRRREGGKVLMHGARLRGNIRIISATPDVYDLNSAEARAQLGQSGDQDLELENVIVHIGPAGKITTEPFAQAA